jgi:transcriptional regulator with XRE-family HTH domain
VGTEFYARIERGGTLPSVPTLVRLADALDMSADALLGRAPPGTDTASRDDRLHENPTGRDPPRPVRLLQRRLRQARPSTVRLLNLVLVALERRAPPEGRSTRRRSRKR